MYLAAGDQGARELLAEHDIRKRAGLPGAYLDFRTLRSEYGFDREAAIVSPGSAEVDPLLLSHALLSAAAARGAMLFDAEATAYDSSSGRVMVATDHGFTIDAGHVVLATGYTCRTSCIRICTRPHRAGWWRRRRRRPTSCGATTR